jgi:hypothetical protein
MEWYFGYQNDIRPAGETCSQRNPSGVATHHLDHQDPVVYRLSCLNAIDRVGRYADGRVMPKRGVGSRKIVVNGLRHSDQIETEIGELVNNVHRAIAADCDERIEIPVSTIPDGILRTIQNIDALLRLYGEMERVAFVRSPKHGSTWAHTPHHLLRRKLTHFSLDQPFETTQYAYDRRTEMRHGWPSDATDEGTQSWAVASAS